VLCWTARKGYRTVRLFLAAPLPEALQTDVFVALTAARRAAAQARWVRPGQLHLTLAFFGETDGSSAQALVEALATVTPRHAGPLLGLCGAACFGRPHAPNVLFAEVTGEVAALGELAADIRSAAGRWLAPEAAGQPFVPHLTLARAKGRHGDAALSRCRRALRGHTLGTFALGRLVLYRSELLAAGSEYTALAEFPLSADATAHA
jgi:2'-5' RNA ligase